MSSAIFLATVRSYSTETQQATVVVPALQGDAPIVADPFVYRTGEEDTLTELEPGDNVLIFYDGGSLARPPKWFVAGGAGAGGDLGDHLEHANPHAQYATDVDLTNHINSANPHPNFDANNINFGILKPERLSGTYDIDITGGSGKWVNPITLTLYGTVNGTAQIDGSGNVSMATSLGLSVNYGNTLDIGQSVADDNRDRGVTFKWNDGSGHLGFFGFDDSTGKFTFIPSATESSAGVFTGTKGEIDANVAWANILNKPDPQIEVNLTGPIYGTGNIDLTDLLNTEVTIETVVDANAITLGAHTVGNYVGGLIGTDHQIYVSGTNDEGGVRTLSLPNDIDVDSVPEFKQLELNQTTGEPPFIIQSTTLVPNLNAERVGGRDKFYLLDWNNHTNKPDPTVTINLTGQVSGSDSLVWTDLVGNVSLTIDTAIAGGAGSGLDADTLRGKTDAFFQDAANLITGTLPASRLSGSYAISVTGSSGSTTGNAATATALQNTRTIAGKSFNGTQNVTLDTLTRGTYLTGSNYNGSAATTWAVDATSANTAGKVVARDGSGDFAANVITAQRYISNVATGTKPLSVLSTTMVDNLTAQYLGGAGGTALPYTYFASRSELGAVSGLLMNVGTYNAEAYDGTNATKPIPQWGGTPNMYRHGMYWLVVSVGTLDFIDADFSGRYDLNDPVVTVKQQDFIIAVDPDFGSPGHELNTDQPLSQMVFQYVNMSADTLIDQKIEEHRLETNPHPEAGYALIDWVTANFMDIDRSFETEIDAAIDLHRNETNPHPNAGYLNETLANDLYLRTDTYTPVPLINAAIANLRNPVLNPDPFPQYNTPARGALLYEPKGVLQAHIQAADPHSQYVTHEEADVTYNPAKAIAEHEAHPDPHGIGKAGYLNEARASALYAPLIHDHDDRYYLKTIIDDKFASLKSDVLTSDGAPSARVWIGNVRKPVGVEIGDLVIQGTGVGATPPGAPNGFSATATSATQITLGWGVWPGSATVTSIRLEWSPNGTTGWANVTGSPFAPSTTGFVDNNALTENTVRYYRLSAHNAAGQGPYASLSATTKNLAPPPPTALNITARTATSLTLAWTAPAGWTDPAPSNRYEVFLNGTSVGYAAGTGTTHQFNGLQDNTYYTVGVRSRDSGGFVSSTVSYGPNAFTLTDNAAPTQQPSGLVITLL